ncbi:MAG: family channel protein [Chitinophagaceae bacterium]|nr:family channel protein [Chitinophagaceae bacterium]
MHKLTTTFKTNYRLYLIEAWGLGLFMVSACLFTILLEHPDFNLVHTISSDFTRRLLIGIAMGATALGIIQSPWGRKSGAHINPAVTLTMWYLHKIPARDVPFYLLFQVIGGTAGVWLVTALLPHEMAHASIRYVVTVPGKAGVTGAIIGEALIAFLLMSVTLISSNHKKIKSFTPYITGLLITSFVTFEAPYSGFSMNPARTLSSALPSGIWTAWPLYMTVPVLSMLTAAVLYTAFSTKRKKENVKHYFTPGKQSNK